MQSWLYFLYCTFILMTHLFCNWKFVSPNFHSPNSPTPPHPSPLASTNLFYISMSLLCFVMFLCSFARICEIIQYLCFSVWFISLSVIPSRSIHVNARFHYFHWLSSILLYVYAIYCCCLVIKYVQLFCNPMDCSCQTPLFVGFPRQEYWSGLPFPSPGHLPSPEIECMSPALAGWFFPAEQLGKPMFYLHTCVCACACVCVCVCVCIQHFHSFIHLLMCTEVASKPYYYK